MTTADTQTLPVTASASGFRWRRFLLAFAATIVVLVGIAAVGAFIYASNNQGRVLPGVSIAGVSVAGLTPEDAKAKLLTELPDVSAGALTVKAGSVEQDIPY